jgi:hypothetical protein
MPRIAICMLSIVAVFCCISHQQNGDSSVATKAKDGLGGLE